MSNSPFQSPTHQGSSWWGEEHVELRHGLVTSFSPLLIGALAGGTVTTGAEVGGIETFSPLLIGALAGGGTELSSGAITTTLSVPYSSGL